MRSVHELTELVGAAIKRVPGSHAAYSLVRMAGGRIRVTREFFVFRAQSRTTRPTLIPRWSERILCTEDRTAHTPFDRHYIYHSAWALRQLQRYKPREHVDVSSSLCFVALGSAVVPMHHLDYRPPTLMLDNLACVAGNLMALPFADNSVESLSCMHVIEHVGLARYGDPLDPSGDIKAAKELSRVLAPGGRLLFVSPVGRTRVCFNGHRIYDFDVICSLFPHLHLAEWALIPDDPSQGLIANATPEQFSQQQYACGCFAFRKQS